MALTGTDPGDAPSALRSPGWWVQFTGVGHTLFSVVVFKDELAEIYRAGLIDEVPLKGPRATAFWFTVAGPFMWAAGKLLRSAEASGDLPAQRTAGAAIAATGLVGAAAMPSSGFWLLVATGFAALRRGLAGR